MNEGITNWTGRSKQVHGFWTNLNEIPEYRREMIKLIVNELDTDSNTVLDCGCGTGLVYEYLPDAYKECYYGLDFTQEMIDYCIDKYDNIDRYKQVNLINLEYEDMEYMFQDVIITQNVLQHILLFQDALDNLFFCANKCIILCERTHRLNTVIAGYDPVYRWRFNIKDMYDILTHYKNRYDYKGEVEIISHPKTTKNETDCLTIFRIYRNRHTAPTYDEKDMMIKPTLIIDKIEHDKRIEKRKKNRVLKYILRKLSLNSLIKD